VTPTDVVTLAALVLVAVVPVAAVCIVALLRGYTISIHLNRRPRRPR
jgi:hypothetical protein